MRARTVFTLASLAGSLLAAPIALAGEVRCGMAAAEIVRKAYPTATALPDGMFELDGARLTLPIAGRAAADDPHVMICRLWPARPDLMLVAVPLMRASAEDGMNEGDLDILVIDGASHDVRQRLRMEGLMADDAIGIEALGFDTARYQLAPANMAFGLRKTVRGSSGPNPYNATSLWLFAIDGRELKPVLEDLVVDRLRGEWDTRCSGEFETLTRTLSMVPSSKAAIADILVSETTVTSVNKGETADNCVSTDKTTKTKHRLLFEGSAYAVPEGMRGL